MKRNYLSYLFLGLLWVGLVACSGAPAAILGNVSASTEEAAVVTVNLQDRDGARSADWSTDTHSNDADPNYEVVFPQDKVNQITITIDPDDWAAMQANMTELLGEQGQEGDGRFGPEGRGFPPPEGGRPEGGPPLGGGPEGGPPAGGGDFTDENPMWVPATIEFEGLTWTNVGVRYKGNSSLNSAWRSGDLKMPLKLDFDEFEDTFPEIDNQRFYGFKQLSLANGFSDNTFMRDTLAYDVLDEAGLVAAETAFYEVILDYGEGAQSLGLYTVIEVIDDTVIETAYGDDDGNIYEGDGSGVSLAENTFDLIADSFQKENNKDEADWSDIEALYNVLHSETRASDPAAWRAELEAVFDVDTFLEWLSISAALQHWDTYGSMTHNFYLYKNPDTELLTWISWDHNMILGSGPGGGPAGGGPEGAGPAGGGRGGGPGGRGDVSFDKADVDKNWPLIRYLLDDPVYYERYVDYVAQTNELLENPEFTAHYEALAEMLAPYAAEDVGADVFETAVQELFTKLDERITAVNEFLAAQ